MRVLILGGTTEASALARAMAQRQMDAIFSYAGRTQSPVAQPLPTRVGGFGGTSGLVTYLDQARITHLVDATHPFAAQMSRNAVAACAQTNRPLVALQRAPWQPQPGDRWQHVPDMTAAAAALSGPPKRVFLAIGKQHLAAFAGQPQHHYLLRLVDRPADPLPLPNTQIVTGKGPFTAQADLALMRAHGTQCLLAKNAGGAGAEAKLSAARSLGLPVIMIDRPKLPLRRTCDSVEDVLHWLAHGANLGV